MVALSAINGLRANSHKVMTIWLQNFVKSVTLQPHNCLFCYKSCIAQNCVDLWSLTLKMNAMNVRNAVVSLTLILHTNLDDNGLWANLTKVSPYGCALPVENGTPPIRGGCEGKTRIIPLLGLLRRLSPQVGPLSGFHRSWFHPNDLFCSH